MGVGNRLATQTSPYLRQHANDPVDWFAWGDEAFAEATRLDRPLLVSVGYSSCHWCHVMAKESFADPDTASILNRLFVNVKVDREEHPAVDEAYLAAVQAMTGRAGWPMTVFALPDGQPFFAGTYFPRHATTDTPSFVEMCLAVADQWRFERSQLIAQATDLSAAITETSRLAPATIPATDRHSQAAAAALCDRFDTEWGGFGTSPKFPMAPALDFLVGLWHRTGDPTFGEVVTTSLDAMAAGGIHDHIEGGFARYAVDRQWLVPHFEKLLVDQALVGGVFLHAFGASGARRHAQVVDETVTYVLTHLAQPGGGFASSEAADTDGTEGTHYVWTHHDLVATLAEGGLDDMEIEAVCNWWGVTTEGQFAGANVLHRPRRGDLVRPAPVERARSILADARRTRARPGLDDKVLTEWNALWLSTLAEAAGCLSHPSWTNAAETLGGFLVSSLRRADGRWMRSWQHNGDTGVGGPDSAGHARHLGCAGDYASVIDGLTRLYELTGDPTWITVAIETAGDMIDLFWDEVHGGVFTTGVDDPTPLPRTKQLTDAALPSANGRSAVALARLAAITGDRRWHQHAVDICRLVAPAAGRHPTAFVHTLSAVPLVDPGPTEVVVSGQRPDLVGVAHRQFTPGAVLVWGEVWDTPLWEGRSGDEPGRAYVCHNSVCDLPTDDVDTLMGQLGGQPLPDSPKT